MLLGCFGTIPYTNQFKNNTIRPKNMFIFSVYPQLYTPQFMHHHLKSKCTTILSDLHFHFVLPSDFFLKLSTLECFSFKATNENWTKNIIIISYEQICMVGVGLGTFWHWVKYQSRIFFLSFFLSTSSFRLSFLHGNKKNKPLPPPPRPPLSWQCSMRIRTCFLHVNDPSAAKASLIHNYACSGPEFVGLYFHSSPHVLLLRLFVCFVFWLLFFPFCWTKKEELTG